MDEKRSIAILWIAKAVLFVILLYVGFGAVTNRLHWGAMFRPKAASGGPQASEAPLAASPERLPTDYGAIVERNLFAEADRTSNPRAGGPSLPALKTMASAEELGLQLVGTFAGSPVNSRALIQDSKSHSTGSYRIGDVVAAGASGGIQATVETIERDVVVLRCQGQDLVLKRRAGTAVDNPAPGAGPISKNDPDKDDPSRSASLAAANAQTAALSSHAGYMAEVFRKATIEPYVKNNQTEGLRITGLENLPGAGLLGLKNGDVVQSVNGQQLTSKQKAFQVLMKAKTQSRVDLQLLRDGKSKNLSFDL